MKYTRTTLTIFVSVLVATASFFGWTYVVYKAYAVARDHAVVRADLAAAMSAEQTTEQEQQFLTSVAATHASIDSYFVTQNTIVSFIEELETLGTHAHVKADILRLDPGSGGKGPLTLELSLSGTYTDIAYYITLLEASPRMVSVDTLAFIRGGNTKGSNTNVWTAQLGAHVQNYDANPN